VYGLNPSLARPPALQRVRGLLHSLAGDSRRAILDHASRTCRATSSLVALVGRAFLLGVDIRRFGSATFGDSSFGRCSRLRTRDLESCSDCDPRRAEGDSSDVTPRPRDSQACLWCTTTQSRERTLSRRTAVSARSRARECRHAVRYPRTRPADDLDARFRWPDLKHADIAAYPRVCPESLLLGEARPRRRPRLADEPQHESVRRSIRRARDAAPNLQLLGDGERELIARLVVAPASR
jgi:hypothetical protein